MDTEPFQPVDRISKLPDNVIDNLLMRLSTRDAAKTSILSKEWRYKWVKQPQLLFDCTLWPESETNLESARVKFLLILYRVILLHEGPITTFGLVVPELKSCLEIDHLINFLLRKGVEKFTFGVQRGYKLPPSLFMYSQLKHLELFYCLIKPPPSFKGFNRLTRLVLLGVTIDAEVLESLISGCPLLEQLVLGVLNAFDYLEIDAPMLKHFELSSFPASFYFKKSPLLAIVIATTYIDRVDDNIMEDGNNNFLEFFNSLPALQELCMDYHYTKILTAGQVQTRLPATLIHLKILRLFYISLGSLDELSLVVCLIRSSPNLVELKIEVLEDAPTDASLVQDFLKEHDYSDLMLIRLQIVKLEFISGTIPEMALIKLLLQHSPKLKRMVIWPTSKGVADKGLGILKELNRFWRASPIAEVMYVDIEDEDEV